jgi:predicted transcriptional regulator
MLSHDDLIHDLADVLHTSRMRLLNEGMFVSELASSMPTQRDREQAEDVVERLVELGLVAELEDEEERADGAGPSGVPAIVQPLRAFTADTRLTRS